MKRGGKLTIALVALSLCSLAAASWVTVFTDHDGGVTLILLRHAPGWPVDTHGPVSADVGHILVRGNENGVAGERLVRWNARYVAWSLSALSIARLVFRRRPRRA